MSEQQTGVKRILVDPDDLKEINPAKKAKYELKIDVKSKVIQFFAEAYFNIWHVTIPQEVSPFNIFASMQVMNIVHTGYNILRQEMSGITSSLSSKAAKGTPTVNIEGSPNQISIDKVKEILSYSAHQNGLSFYRTKPTAAPQTMEVDQPFAGTSGTQTQTQGLEPTSMQTGSTQDSTPAGMSYGEEWFGVAGPYCNFLTGFGLRMKELRLGHSEFPFKKNETVSRSYPIHKFGLNRLHHVLLEGIRFPPERRSSMVQSLGPMTVLLCYLTAPAAYENKFANACKILLGHIPNIDQVIKAMKGKEFHSIKPIITLIGDITIMTTSRQHNRSFPPPCAFFYACTTKETAARISVTTKIRPQIHKDSDILSAHVSMSGFNSALLYNRCAKEIKFTLSGSFSTEEAAQIIFHCWWGTYKEDLSILSQITSQNNWYKRDHFGKKFQKMNSGIGRTTNIGLMTIRQFAKLSSANQTSLLTQGSKQIASIPVFGGVRERKFSEDFFKYMAEQSPIGTNSVNLQSIQADLSKISEELNRKLLERGGAQDAGTVMWIDYELNNSLEIYKGLRKPTFNPNFKPIERCIYFLG